MIPVQNIDSTWPQTCFPGYFGLRVGEQPAQDFVNAHYTDPAIAAVVWQALNRAGFSGGRVLEPGCGAGTFIGHAPNDAVMVGVENDATTAAIAAQLYPSAQIRHEGFETTRVPENSFTAAIGNVPFGRYALADPAHNPARHSIHNHFIIKALALTAPGGYVAVLTSRYTMDSAKAAARRDIAANADLIAAIRLPTKAFTRVAGTQVVTDLLILRRRDPQTPTPEQVPDRVNTEPIELADPATGNSQTLPINTYFVANPHNVLGDMQLGHGLNGSHQLVVAGAAGAELAEQLRARLHPIIDSAIQRGMGLTATAADLTDVSTRLFDPGLITAADRGPDTPLLSQVGNMPPWPREGRLCLRPPGCVQSPPQRWCPRTGYRPVRSRCGFIVPRRVARTW